MNVCYAFDIVRLQFKQPS